jgi:hypothetical protein
VARAMRTAGKKSLNTCSLQNEIEKTGKVLEKQIICRKRGEKSLLKAKTFLFLKEGNFFGFVDLDIGFDFFEQGTEFQGFWRRALGCALACVPDFPRERAACRGLNLVRRTPQWRNRAKVARGGYAFDGDGVEEDVPACGWIWRRGARGAILSRWTALGLGCGRGDVYDR